MAWSPVRIILNILRVLSILSLLLVVASSLSVNYFVWPKIGESNTVFQFANRILISLVCLLLVLAECERPKFILKHFDVVREEKSWAGMGFIQLCVGSFILGYDSIITSISSTKVDLYYLVLVPGWFLLIIGFIYILLGVIGGLRIRAMRRGETYDPSDYLDYNDYKAEFKKDTLQRTYGTPTSSYGGTPYGTPYTLLSLPRVTTAYAASVSSGTAFAADRDDVESVRPPVPPPRVRTADMRGTETVKSGRGRSNSVAPSNYSESVYGHYM
ncbi:hypothetical protein HK097_001010 [Rhizophlyctis rosea]|uniref:DUF7598 domain-containing protein n=1 Tax=Rhizophlyctis rosea TaxID=64517 RepID=A0AAD5S781_9FUNG|nr:hypothetical protein HK097_001010 [Rhizophlyctis rosea]